MKGRARIALVLFALGVCFPRPARATDPVIRSMIVGGLYGMAGGTVVGLLTVPLTGTFRSTFVGTSVGLYLGIVVGVFYVMEKDNPQNPLRPNSTSQPQGASLGPGLPPAPGFVGDRETELASERPGEVRFSLPVARF